MGTVQYASCNVQASDGLFTETLNCLRFSWPRSQGVVRKRHFLPFCSLLLYFWVYGLRPECIMILWICKSVLGDKVQNVFCNMNSVWEINDQNEVWKGFLPCCLWFFILVLQCEWITFQAIFLKLHCEILSGSCAYQGPLSHNWKSWN